MAKREKKEEPAETMTLEEARKFRASLAKPAAPQLREEQKREAWRVFWAQNKTSFGRGKELEEIIWLHLKAIKKDDPSNFEEGIKHFGLKRIS